MIPFYDMSRGFDFVGLKSPLRFSDVEVLAIPSTCLVNDFRPLGMIHAIFVWKERFDVTSVQKNNSSLG